MPRSLVTGNGNLLVALDSKNMLRDLYFPYVGMEDQIAYQHLHRIGVFVDDRFSWMHNPDWQHTIQYVKDTVVTDSSAKNNDLQLAVHFNDFVYPTEDILVRKITIHNEADYDRSIRLFFAQDLHLYGDKQQDTAFYEPEHKAMVHYRKRRYFWFSGMTEDGKEGVDSFTAGKSEYRGLEGTWRDAEDGHLHENAIEQGSVDSTVQFDLEIKGKEKVVLYFWTCAGKDMEEVTNLHKFILDETPEKLLENTINYWQSWVNKEDEKTASIPTEFQKAYNQSLLIMRTQIDNRGAIIAANDSDIMKFNKDTYTYMWPRDGAWVATALDRAGYGEVSKRFFEFCAEVITKEGYLMPKYNPDHSEGSSWHPWIKQGDKQLPIQEDETAIVLHALHQHYHYFGDIEFMQKMYMPLIRGAGNFMMNYTDTKTGLPLPSYDLWERERGVSAYTASTVYAGLMAAAHLSEILGHFHHHRRYEKAANKIKEATLEHLYDEKEKRFLKRLEIDEKTGEIKKDYIIDASLHGLWMFGVLPPDDKRIVATMEAVYSALKVPTEVGGLTRYEYDDYQRVVGDYHEIPGNPWIITTLWHAQWLLETAKSKADLEPVEQAMHWTINHMNEAGILPEQLNPFTGEHLSVAPLTWSHSTFVDTVLKYNEKLEELS